MSTQANAGASEPESAGEPRAVVAAPRSPPSTDLIADGIRTRESYAVSLEVFEGPLDLLLHLVRRHELDILDIPIKFIASKYIEYISFARALDIEVAGEYLVMAATLAFLKSRELLPVVAEEELEADDEDEGVDPREELIRRLIEYERFRNAGEDLHARPLAGRDVFSRGATLAIETPDPGLAPVTLFKLAEAYNRILDRAMIKQEHEVVIERVTVRQRMLQLSSMLRTRSKVSFESLFLGQTWASETELRQMLVVTLMSVLEMCKLGIMGVHQAQGSDTLNLERAMAVDEMLEAVEIFRENGAEEEEEEEEEGYDAEAALASVEALKSERPVGDAELAAVAALQVEDESGEGESDEHEPDLSGDDESRAASDEREPDLPGNDEPGESEPDLPGNGEPGEGEPDLPGNGEPGDGESAGEELDLSGDHETDLPGDDESGEDRSDGDDPDLSGEGESDEGEADLSGEGESDGHELELAGEGASEQDEADPPGESEGGLSGESASGGSSQADGLAVELDSREAGPPSGGADPDPES